MFDSIDMLPSYVLMNVKSIVMVQRDLLGCDGCWEYYKMLCLIS